MKWIFILAGQPRRGTDAVRAASPLPLPSDMRYFQRNLQLAFVVPD